MAQLLNQEAVLHVRFDGQSLDIPLGDLDVGTASEDREIKRALARHLEVPEAAARLHRRPPRDRQRDRPARGRVRLIESSSGPTRTQRHERTNIPP